MPHTDYAVQEVQHRAHIHHENHVTQITQKKPYGTEKWTILVPQVYALTGRATKPLNLECAMLKHISRGKDKTIPSLRNAIDRIIWIIN